MFAKTDIQPAEPGANHADVAASIYQAVVNQTSPDWPGGASGEGPLPGRAPLLLQGLRIRFQETLKLTDEEACSRSTDALPGHGRGLYARTPGDLHHGCPPPKSRPALRSARGEPASAPLRLRGGLRASGARHPGTTSPPDIADYSGGAGWASLRQYHYERALLGRIGSCSTLLQLQPGQPGGDRPGAAGNIYGSAPPDHHPGSAVTATARAHRAAFGVDKGVVETIATTPPQALLPEVDSFSTSAGRTQVLQILNGAMILLCSTSCSSGCGSFIETFAKSMGCDVRVLPERSPRRRAGELEAGAPVYELLGQAVPEGRGTVETSPPGFPSACETPSTRSSARERR